MEIKSRYDEIERFHARKNQEDPWVMYLIVRDSLGMSPGKVAAQCGHAVGKLYDHFMGLDPLAEMAPFNSHESQMLFDFNHWMDSSFRKIVLRAKDSKWEQLKTELNCVVVRDAGLTEIESGSETVIGVWPCKKSQVPLIIKKLQTL